MALAGAAAVATLNGAAGADSRELAGQALFGDATGRQGELRETVAIARRRGARPESVLSLRLPPIKPGDRIRFNGEVTITTTCVEPLPRCIGRPYRFDPRLRAWIVIGRDRRDAGSGTRRVTGRIRMTCEQTRPNRNHHCPLVLSEAIAISRPERLPCPAGHCRLNMIVSAHHPNARGGEVVVVGADRPDGSVEGGKGRLSAAVARAGRDVELTRSATHARRVRRLPASFDGGQRVVYSQRVGRLAAGDVLLARARHRTRIRRLPYFVATKIVLATRPDARNAGPLTRRIATRRGTLTETNGFNCTIGPSAFRSPCTTKKAGLVMLQRAPTDRRGEPRPLYVNLVSRTFPKLAQARRRAYPPAHVLRGGGLTVTRLRAG